MFGSKSAKINELQAQVTDLGAVVASYEQHSGYLEVARQIHEEHVQLIGNSLGGTAVAGVDAYEAAVQVVRGQELTKARNSAVEAIVGEKRGAIYDQFVKELMDDPDVQDEADRVVNTPEYQEKLAQDARVQAIQNIVESRKEAKRQEYDDLLQGHLESEVKRAKQIAALNFEFDATGMLNVDNSRLKDILKNGDYMDVDIARPDGYKVRVVFTWLESPRSNGFVYSSFSVLVTDKNKTPLSIVLNDYYNNFFGDLPAVNLGGTAGGSAAFDPFLTKDGKFSFTTPEGAVNSYGRVYIRLTHYSEALGDKNRAYVKGVKVHQRQFAPDTSV